MALYGEPCAGYTLLGSPENDAGADFSAFLVDMEGDVVHTWQITGFPPKMLPGGSLIGCSGVVSGNYDCREMRQESWSGDLEWSFSNWSAWSDGTNVARHHHDFQREGNPVGFYAPGCDFTDRGTTLVLAHTYRSSVGFRNGGALTDDSIYEVDWSGELTGWEWHAYEHFDEFGFDDDAIEDIATRGGNLEWLHGNAISRVGENRWWDAGYEAFNPKNIIYSSRSAAFVIIIAHDTGQVVWRIGPDFAGRPEEGLGQFAGQHSPYIIPSGLPGAGNMIVFDNGGAAGYGGDEGTFRYRRHYSRVVEFDPVSLEIVWQYGSEEGNDFFFSPFISSAQRLPNGNTLITIGTSTRVIEVTPEKEIVWDFSYTPTSSGAKATWLYRAYRVPPEWLPAGVNSGRYATWESLYE